jgi:hypothetical protein
MSFFPIFERCRKTDRFPGTVLLTAALNCHAKRKIRTDPDGNVLRNSGPVFDCLWCVRVYSPDDGADDTRAGVEPPQLAVLQYKL